MTFVKHLPSIGKEFKRIRPENWPSEAVSMDRIAVWQNDDFLVQVFAERDGIVRLTVCRTLRKGGHWKDGITWDELQFIKDAVGYDAFDAVEVYPRHCDVVNVANMRHLWILPEAVRFAWRVDLRP